MMTLPLPLISANAFNSLREILISFGRIPRLATMLSTLFARFGKMVTTLHAVSGQSFNSLREIQG